MKSISALAHTIPANPPLKTTLLSSVSSDGLINVYDLAQVFENTAAAEENKLDPVGSYNTKGSRLTCCFLADGRKERIASEVSGKASATTAADGPEEAADLDDAEDDEDDAAEGMYDSAQEEDEDEEEDELEEEEEDEEEAEYE